MCWASLTVHVFLLLLLPRFVIHAKTFLAVDALEGGAVEGRPLADHASDRRGLLGAPRLEGLVLILRADPEVLVVHDRVRPHPDNKAPGAGQDDDEGVHGRLAEE